MVFADLNTIDNNMASIAAGGGTFANVNSPVTLPSKSLPQNNPPPKKSTIPSSTELSLPAYDASDPRAVLKTLIRCIMRTFYDIPKSLVIEYIYYHGRIKQQDLAELLCLDSKIVRLYIQEFKRDKFIIEDHRLESNDSNTGRRNLDQYYYKIDDFTFVNVVRYRLEHMRTYVENLERQQIYKQSNYKCEQCAKTYTELDVGKLYDFSQDALLCFICGGIVQEDVEMKEESTNTTREAANMILFNEQTKSLIQILRQIEQIEQIMIHDQQTKTSSDQDSFQLNGNNSFNAHSAFNKDNPASNHHRSHASNVFDRTSHINHDIQIIIEKDDDDQYSHEETDEASNTESAISSSRGPGKPGKKSSKPVQSAAEVASQPVSTKMKLASKKVPYEPKPMPSWFVRSTVYVDQDEEHRMAHSSSSQPTGHSSSLSRQLSNQKLLKSNSINDIKQMLLVHESRRKKTFPLTTMEDSLSPPTPIQMTKTTNSQSSTSLSQFNSNPGGVGGPTAMDEDDTATSLFHLINEESVHHMDIDKND